MIAKEYLTQLKPYQKEIAYLEKQINIVSMMAENPRSPRYGEPIAKGSKPGDNVANLTVRKIELEEMLADINLEYCLTRFEMQKLIDKLNEVLDLIIIHDHYILNKSLKECAEACGRSYDYIRSYHRIALQHFQEILDNELGDN